jgi:hypothetical protein
VTRQCNLARDAEVLMRHTELMAEILMRRQFNWHVSFIYWHSSATERLTEI